MAEPVSLTEIKAHVSVDDNDRDALLAAMGVAAREWVEAYTGLILTPRTVTQVVPSFAGALALNAWPVAASPALTVTYVDSAGVTQTVAGPRLAMGGRPARVMPVAGGYWPSGYAEQITISVAAGYATPGDVPASLKAAILLIVGSLFAVREDAVVGTIYTPTRTVEMLCEPFRLAVLG